MLEMKMKIILFYTHKLAPIMEINEYPDQLANASDNIKLRNPFRCFIQILPFSPIQIK